MSRLGFDVDGVLADFATDYQSLVIAIDGTDRFEIGDSKNPPCWNWPELRGYSAETMRRVKDIIHASPHFWDRLFPLEGARTLLLLPGFEDQHDVYFITDRGGVTAKRQTEEWLRFHCGFRHPTVLISKDKDLLCRALQLDVYIDDRAENIKAVANTRTNPQTRVYCLNYRHNQDIPASDNLRYTRVNSVAAMLQREGL